MHVAGTDADQNPILKTVHGVVDEGWVCFHSSPAGEKTSLLGRPVVVSVERTIARVPSFFFDPERACPATTLFMGAQVRGRLQAIEQPERKARILSRLMEKLQPQGGYQPIAAEHPLYSAAVRGLLVAGVPLETATSKLKLAQNRNESSRLGLIERLWERGEPTDPEAIERILAANPSTPRPSFLTSTKGLRLHAWLPPIAAHEAATLLADEPWNLGIERDCIAQAHVGSAAWVGATDDLGALCATARAISDGAKTAWVFDVCVRPDLRGQGLGTAVVTLLLDHPAVRRCHTVRLNTRTAEPLYGRLGFVRTELAQGRLEMARQRASHGRPGASPGQQR